MKKTETTIIEDSITIKKFFGKNKEFETLIRDNIANILPILIDDKPYKISTADPYKYREKTIYEYKIILNEDTECRVAYIHEGSRRIVFFISNITIKSEFLKLISNLEDISR